MKFGDPVALRSSQGTRSHVGVYLGELPGDRVCVWFQRIRVGPPSMAQPWRCPQCQGTRVWWSLKHVPGCARCVPVPQEVLEELWAGAQQFLTALAEGKAEYVRAACFSELDEAVANGNLRQLARLSLGARLLRRDYL